jgi:HEAT repeat protein
MTRFPRRLLPSLAIACSITVSGLMAQTAPAPDDAAAKPATAAPAAAAPATPSTPAVSIPQNQNLRDDVDDFWHYGKVARYDLATAFGNKLLSRPEPPLEVLHAFETTASEHQDNLDDWMIRWRTIDNPQMKDVADKIQKLLDKGRWEERTQPKIIAQNIQRLATGPRGYANGLAQLRDSGEIAVPIMIDFLRDPNRAQFHEVIVSALADMGRVALNPLLAATEMKDNDTLLSLISVLGNIQYDAAVPYLARLSQDQSRPAATRQAAANALHRIGGNTNAATPDLFYRLAEKFYYNNASITADPKAPTAYMWSWNDQQGLNFKTVPPAVFTDLMAMREARHALELGAGSGDALALWLAANNKVEVDLPEGATVAVFAQGRPSANYFNVYAGPQYLNAVLTRCLSDHNSAVALKVIKSLAEIVGPSNGSVDPLVQAMHYPDRLVRFEAAFALASGQPTRTFAGHELVAPLLAEAVAQTGAGNVLIVAGSQNDYTKIAEALSKYGTAGAGNAQQAMTNAAELPWVDVIVISEGLGTEQIDNVYSAASRNPRLERVAKVIVASASGSPTFQRGASDPLTVVTADASPAGIQKAVQEARQRAGGIVLDEKTGTAYAMRAATLLQQLAASHSQVYDLSVARTQLLASLNDKRPEIVRAVAEALAYMNGDQIQPALLARGIDQKTPDEAKVGLLQGLARNAKFFGNHLDEQQLGQLQQAVESAQNLDVRTAAAEARGALNLPADQARALIVKEGTP